MNQPILQVNDSGPQLSGIVAGTWRLASWGFTAQETLAWIETCVGLGITGFDHADVYGDYTVEGLFGDALVRAPPSLRAKVRVVTKCGIKLLSGRRPVHRIKSYDTSAEHIRASVDASLKSLRIDRIELLLLHRPDLLANPAEIASVVDALRSEGKIRHFGVSNHSAAQFALLNRFVPLATNQIQFSPLCLDALSDGTLDQCTELGLRPMIWSPLAGGKLMIGTDERSVKVRSVLGDIAQAHGIALSTAAFAWIAKHPSRPLIVTGTHRAQGLTEAVAALSVDLGREQWYQVWRAGAGREVA